MHTPSRMSVDGVRDAEIPGKRPVESISRAPIVYAALLVGNGIAVIVFIVRVAGSDPSLSDFRQWLAALSLLTLVTVLFRLITKGRFTMSRRVRDPEAHVLLEGSLDVNNGTSRLDVVLTHVPEDWGDYRRIVGIIAESLQASGDRHAKRNARSLVHRRPAVILHRIPAVRGRAVARNLVRAGATVVVQCADHEPAQTSRNLTAPVSNS